MKSETKKYKTEKHFKKYVSEDSKTSTSKIVKFRKHLLTFNRLQNFKSKISLLKKGDDAGINTFQNQYKNH